MRVYFASNSLPHSLANSSLTPARTPKGPNYSNSGSGIRFAPNCQNNRRPSRVESLKQKTTHLPSTVCSNAHLDFSTRQRSRRCPPQFPTGLGPRFGRLRPKRQVGHDAASACGLAPQQQQRGSAPQAQVRGQVPEKRLAARRQRGDFVVPFSGKGWPFRAFWCSC